MLKDTPFRLRPKADLEFVKLDARFGPALLTFPGPLVEQLQRMSPSTGRAAASEVVVRQQKWAETSLKNRDWGCDWG